ncbi:hypothetical protein GQ457_01G018610 [Hibiscus cannabinus]
MEKPTFNGEIYFQWSNVLKYFILAQDFEVCEIIEKGYMKAPKKKNKKRSENVTKTKLNTRAMYILLCGLNEEVSKTVSTCKRVKEMWDKLKRLYEKEEKRDGVSSRAKLLQSSKVDGVLALDEPNVSSNSNELDSYSFDDLQDSFDELYLKFEAMNSKFKKIISKLEVENDFLLKIKLDFENQNEILKNELDISKSSNDVLEKENLDLKVKLESLTKEKEIISYNTYCHIMAKCSHRHYHGHSIHTCPVKKRKSYRIRQLCDPKGTRDIEIDVNGSKAIWIPKSK